MSLTFLDLKDIAEREIELVNPTSPEKILEIGRKAGMSSDQIVIDYGCGYAEPLTLWAQEFGVSGIGIELRLKAVGRARAKVKQRGLADRLKIIQGRGADYPVEPGSFDYATCIGASFVWQDLHQALAALKRAIRPGGKIILGEPYWLKDQVPPDLAQTQAEFHSEAWLLHTFRQAGLEVAYVLHSSHDDWDRYETSNWHGLLRWIAANQEHPDLSEVVAHLHESQDEYFHYGREYFGWALYLLVEETVLK